MWHDLEREGREREREREREQQYERRQSMRGGIIVDDIIIQIYSETGDIRP